LSQLYQAFECTLNLCYLAAHELQTITDINNFKKKLKAHFYNQAFCVD